MRWVKLNAVRKDVSSELGKACESLLLVKSRVLRLGAYRYDPDAVQTPYIHDLLL